MKIMSRKDGTDLVLVIKNFDRLNADERSLVTDFLNSVQKDVTRISFGRYKDMTAEEILEKEGDMGYANLVYLIVNRRLPLSVEETIETVNALDEYMTRRASEFGDVVEYAAGASADEIENAFKYLVANFSEKDINAILKDSGYGNMSDFRKEVSTEEKRRKLPQLLCILREHYPNPE